MRVEGLSVGFRGEDGRVRRAVDGVDLTLRKGEVTGLVGESGCGKSVTALTILRLLPEPPCVVEGGRVWFGGRDLLEGGRAGLRGVRGRRIGMIFQEPMSALSPLKRIGEQLAEAAELSLGLGRKEGLALGLEWLKRVGIPDAEARMGDWPHQLSGGMRQRVMLAMAMLPEPDVLLCDEPTTALDVTVQAQIFELLREVRGGETAVLMITHDMGVVWEVCDRVNVMYAGRIVERGTREEVFGGPLHPYTRGLLASMPRLEGARKGRLAVIPGQPPEIGRWGAGCRFAERCGEAEERCRGEAPPRMEGGGGHGAECWKAGAMEVDGMPGFRDSGMPPGGGGAGGGSEEMRL